MDDETVNGKELEGRLTRLGYQVAGIASSEDDAIAMVGKAAPDLVLVDMGLRNDVNSVGADRHTVENYISQHTSSLFSHSICPSCMATVVERQLENMERE